MTWLFFLGGCASPSPATLYIQAAQDPAHPRACEGILDARLYGECVAMTAAEIAILSGSDPAQARCQRLAATDPWQGECYFLISDAIGATGEPALALCEAAGRYRARCAGHALQREARDLLSALSPGEEGEALRALTERSALYFSDRREGSQQVWHILVEHIASRDYGAPFSMETCGSVPEPLCVSAFVTRLRFAERDRLHTDPVIPALCQQAPITSDAAQALGLHGWTEDAASVAHTGLTRLCGRPIDYPEPDTPSE